MSLAPISKRALTREPGTNYVACISCHPMRHTIDLKRARSQHAAYRNALAELGIEVISIPRDDEHADACFVEDNAVIHNGRALICRPAKASRRGEVGAVEDVLREHMKVKRATAPATVEGGDVIHLPDKLVSGVSQRTNTLGINQMREWLGIEVVQIKDPKMVHLKSYATYLGKGMMIAADRLAERRTLEGFEIIRVPEEEGYAANTLAIGDTVLMSKGRPKSAALVREAGFDVVTLDTSEFEKCEGALTCLSLLF